MVCGGPHHRWRGDFVIGRPWFEVFVVFGVILGELKVFAGESPDVVDVRPPAEGDDFGAAGAPDPEGAAGRLGSPGAAVAGLPIRSTMSTYSAVPFGTGPQPRHMRAAITVGPRPRRLHARPT